MTAGIVSRGSSACAKYASTVAPLGMAAVVLFKPSAGPPQYKAERSLDRGVGAKAG